MNKNYQTSEIAGLLDSSSDILICLPQKVVFDHVAAGLSLFLSLQKMGKKVSIASSSPMVVEFSHLVGLDQMKTKLEGNDLVLSIPVEKVEKVLSNEVDGKLNLVIQAKAGVEGLTKDEVLFSTAGVSAQTVIVIGAAKLEDLGAIYSENIELFQEAKLININNQAVDLGGINLVDVLSSSISEMMVALIENLNLPFDTDIASNLFLGLRAATNNFISKNVTADTFEAAAFCLRINQTKTVTPEPEPPVEEVIPSPEETPADWLEPKIYKGTSIS